MNSVVNVKDTRLNSYHEQRCNIKRLDQFFKNISATVTPYQATDIMNYKF